MAKWLNGLIVMNEMDMPENGFGVISPFSLSISKRYKTLYFSNVFDEYIKHGTVPILAHAAFRVQMLIPVASHNVTILNL